MGSSRNSSSPLMDEMRPESLLPVQWWKVPVKWCSREDARGQDVCIRLVRNSINDQEAGRSPVLALIAAHSRLLVTCCQLFRDMAQTFEAIPRSPCTFHQVTIHVDGDDIVPYIDCFTIMYNPAEEGSQLYQPSKAPFSSMQEVKYALGLLGAASHIGYDALSTSIYEYFCETLIQSGEQMPMLVLAESRLRMEALLHLIRTYCHSSTDWYRRWIVDIMKKARLQEWSPTPTFEQDVVAIVREELKRLLVEAHNECGGESAFMGGSNALLLPELLKNICDMLIKVCDMLKVLLKARVANDGVKWLLLNSWIPKLFAHGVVLNSEGDDLFEKTLEIKVRFRLIVARVYKEVGDGKYVLLKNSDRYLLLKDWSIGASSWSVFVKLLEERAWERYAKAKRVIFHSLPHKMQMDLLVMMADHGSLVTFGRPEELLKLFKDSMAARNKHWPRLFNSSR